MTMFNSDQVETQPFNSIKYQALAYMVQPYGPKLAEAVEDDWLTWLKTIEKAKWLKRWRHYLSTHSSYATPKGNLLELSTFDAQLNSIALLLYSNAVWGFGIEDWLKRANPKKVTTIESLNNSVSKLFTPSNFFDQQILKRTNLLIPQEYGDLDRWLEKLWLDII